MLLLNIGGFTIAGMTLAGFAGKYHWFFDLFSHFRIQYFAVLTALSIFYTLTKRYTMASFLLLFTAINYYVISPYIWTQTPEPATEAPVYRALISNVLSTNGEAEQLLSFIDETNPDIVLVMEMSPPLLSTFEPLRAAYPHQLIRPRTDTYGIAFYSRYPIRQGDAVEAGNVSVPVLSLTLDMEDQLLQFYGLHALVPVSSRRYEHQRLQLESIADQVKAQDQPTIVAGDLNTTQWSHHFRSFMATSQLEDPSRQYSIMPSWPAHFPPLAIPIDHFLHSDDVFVVRRFKGPFIGSDHYPFVVDFSIRNTQRPPAF